MLVSQPRPPRGEGLRVRVPFAFCIRSLSPLALVAALVLPGCYDGYDHGEPWMPGDDGADDGDDDDDGEDGAADGGGDGADGGADGGDDGRPDDGGQDDGGGVDDGGVDDGGMDDGGMDDGGMDDGGMDDGGMDDGEPPANDPEVPDNAYCTNVTSWDQGWSQLEQDVLDLVNEVRATGYNCGSGGNFGPAGPLTMQPNLRCAARVHSKDMDERNFFDHTNPSGESPFDRMGMAGYSFSTAGENIAGGSPDAAGTMDQWLNSSGHCANIMNPSFTEIGVGYHPGGNWGTLWTQKFGG